MSEHLCVQVYVRKDASLKVLVQIPAVVFPNDLSPFEGGGVAKMVCSPVSANAAAVSHHLQFAFRGKVKRAVRRRQLTYIRRDLAGSLSSLLLPQLPFHRQLTDVRRDGAGGALSLLLRQPPPSRG